MATELTSVLYVMDGDTVRNAYDMNEWAAHMASPSRQIRLDRADGVTISTIFLGLKNANGTMFETAVWPEGKDVRVVRRYRTRDEAVAGHYQILAAIQQGKDPNA